MSVYYHVSDKDEILDGIVDIVFGEIELPLAGGDWRAELTRRAHSARRVLRAHPWATALLESRTHPGPASLKHHDAVLGTLRAAGVSAEMTAHANALLDATCSASACKRRRSRSRVRTQSRRLPNRSCS
jgi:AcrR family transcriptional regulator